MVKEGIARGNNQMRKIVNEIKEEKEEENKTGQKGGELGGKRTKGEKK